MENVNNHSTSIKNWAADDRPREKLVLKGVAALSNAELVAILINNGSKDKSAVDLAKEILKLASDNLNELGKFSLSNFKKIKGIGIAKAVTITAALELGRRRHTADFLETPTITSTKNVAEYLKTVLKDYHYEVFAVLFLNNLNKVINFQILSTGGISSTIVDQRLIFKKAFEINSTSLILSHNHPSGSLLPSKDDIVLTKKIKEAAFILDLKILDHIIVSQQGYYSFADNDLM